MVEIIETGSRRTHEIRIRELKTNESKSFSIKTKDSLQTLFVKIVKQLKGKLK